MEGSLKAISYNCRGFPKSSAKIREKPTIGMLLQDKSVDIIALQETFLSKQELGCLNMVHRDFQGIGVSTADSRDKLITSHPQGGVAILFRTTLSKCISPLFFNLDWVVGINIFNGSYHHTILCVYLKCASGREDHAEIFQGQLEELKHIIEGLNTTSVSIMGDFNADFANPAHRHGQFFKQFIVNNGLTNSSEVMLPADSFTFVSEMRQGETSWLDHCISTQDGHNIISNVTIEYNLACSDHLPISVLFNINKLPTVCEETNEYTLKLNWDDFDPVKLREYELMSDIKLSSLSFNDESFNCRNTSCKDINHINHIKILYNNLCKCLTDASDTVFGKIKKGNYKCEPGFNEFVKEKHEMARRSFLAWKDANRPRDPNNHFFREMSVSRARFKLALRHIRARENQLRQDAIAEALCEDSEGMFWKEIKKVSRNSVPLPMTIENATGQQEVVKMWENHFKTLFNCIKGKNCYNLDVNVEFDPQIEIKPSEIEDAIHKLSRGKSCGLDGIYAEHLKYSSNSIWSILSKCITSFLVHGFLPDSLMSVVLCPIIKDKAGKINSKDNYRPIAIASIMSKLLERILLDRLDNFVITSSHQFGFKSKHSTDACIYVLKEAIDYYTSQQSSIYMCFLDASKAFDRVNHYVLFDKLIKKGVPGYLVRILIFWYTKQVMTVKWGSMMSNIFNVTNGVRQGGILSPYLFNVYMDKLSAKLKNVYTGCKIANQIINHLFYADDIILMSPSQVGMQDLLIICEEYANSHDIKFNTSKSVTVVRRSKLMKKTNIEPFYLCNEELSEVKEAKYLGHYISAEGNDEKDMLRACRQLYAQGNSLIRKFGVCSEKVKVKLFQTYCSQVYCAHLWKYKASDKVYRKLNVAFNNVFRLFLRLPRDEQGRPCSASGMFVNRKLKSLQEIIRNSVFKFINRIELSNNDLVKSTLFKNIRDMSKLRDHWNKLLYVHRNNAIS